MHIPLATRFGSENVPYETPVNVKKTINFETIMLHNRAAYKNDEFNSLGPIMFDNLVGIGYMGKHGFYDIKSFEDFTNNYARIGTPLFNCIDTTDLPPVEYVEIVKELVEYYANDSNVINDAKPKRVKVNIDISIQEIEDDEEYTCAKKWAALSKLSESDIETLGLTMDYVHLKLKFHDEINSKDDY